MSEVRLIAHRGLSSSAPENTLSAFKLACDAGVWGVECDVFQSSDGEFIITHDKNLQRMCGVDLDVTTITVETIKKHRINSGNNIHLYPDEITPTLDEYLSLLSNCSGVHPVVEIKDEFISYETGIKLLQIFDKYYSRDDVWVISESLSNLMLLRMLDDTINLQLILINVQDVSISSLMENNIGVDVLYKSLTKDMVETLHQHSIDVNTWTVDIRDVAYTLTYDYGVDYITSNYPTSLLER